VKEEATGPHLPRLVIVVASLELLREQALAHQAQVGVSLEILGKDPELLIDVHGFLELLWVIGVVPYLLG
jgi:hypothetical protein